MKRYDPENYPAMEESIEGRWVEYADIEKQDKLFEKLTEWHRTAIRHAMHLGDQVEKLEEQNGEMLKALQTIRLLCCCGAKKNHGEIIELIEKIEGEQNGR